jgi:hypothetical protein
VQVVPKVFVTEAQFEPAVQRAVQALAPDVVRIRFSLDEDWTGNPSIFFRIVLSDDAPRKERLGDIARRVMSTIHKEVMPDDLGLNAYFNYRTLAEQSDLKDPKWA